MVINFIVIVAGGSSSPVLNAFKCVHSWLFLQILRNLKLVVCKARSARYRLFLMVIQQDCCCSLGMYRTFLGTIKRSSMTFLFQLSKKFWDIFFSQTSTFSSLYGFLVWAIYKAFACSVSITFPRATSEGGELCVGKMDWESVHLQQNSFQSHFPASGYLSKITHRAHTTICCYLCGEINLKHLNLSAKLQFMSYKWLSLRGE